MVPSTEAFPGREPLRWLGHRDELQQARGEPRGVAGLLAGHAAEEPGLDDGGVDAGRDDLTGESFHPSFGSDLRRDLLFDPHSAGPAPHHSRHHTLLCSVGRTFSKDG